MVCSPVKIKGSKISIPDYFWKSPKEKNYNFSGRPENRKLTTEEIVTDIYNNYNDSVACRKILYELSVNNFSFEDKLKEVVDEVFRCKTEVISFTSLKGHELQMDHDIAFANWYCHLQNIVKNNNDIIKEDRDFKGLYENLKEEYVSLANSCELLRRENEFLLDERRRVHEKNSKKLHRKIGRYIKEIPTCFGMFNISKVFGLISKNSKSKVNQGTK